MKNINLHIPASSVIVVILVLAGAYAVWVLRDIFLIVLTSIVIASAIAPLAKSISKYKVPRVLSVLFVYLAFFASFLGVIFFVLPPILQETRSLIYALPQYFDLSITQSANSGELSGIIKQINEILSAVEKGDFIFAIQHVFGGLLSFILIIVFSFYFAINENGTEEFLRVVTPKDYENYVLDLWHRAQKKIGLWLQGQLLLAVLIGVLVYLGLMVLGIPYALPLAVLAAVFELIPVFGPILSALPAVALAYASGGIAPALMVVGLYIIIQQFENHLIYPLVVTKVVGVPPVLSILALLVGAQMAGVLGILLSIPIASVLQEIFDDWGQFKNKAKRLKSKKV